METMKKKYSNTVFWQGWLFNEPLHNKQHGSHNKKVVSQILFPTHKTELHKNVLQI